MSSYLKTDKLGPTDPTGDNFVSIKKELNVEQFDAVHQSNISATCSCCCFEEVTMFRVFACLFLVQCMLGKLRCLPTFHDEHAKAIYERTASTSIIMTILNPIAGTYGPEKNRRFVHTLCRELHACSIGTYTRVFGLYSKRIVKNNFKNHLFSVCSASLFEQTIAEWQHIHRRCKLAVRCLCIGRVKPFYFI